MKKSAIAPSNIAFIKYWGKKDEALRLPENGSISMCLNNLVTHTTVEFNEGFSHDEIVINNKQEKLEGNKAIKHLERIRAQANITTKAKVVSVNNFPTGTGLSSSASGFAALSVAAAAAAGLDLDQKDLSILARQGSGSACRSIPDGFVEWVDGDTSETSFAHTLFEPHHWDIVDVVAIVSAGKKDISTTDGQKLTRTSPFFSIRKDHMAQKIAECKKYIKNKNFTSFGLLTEAEALELHAIMLTSSPSLIYWTPGTLEIMKLVKKWRTEGLESYFTINTGQDIHILTQQKDAIALKQKLQRLSYVKDVIVNKPSRGARLTNNHLF